jgi:hypothetical protein
MSASATSTALARILGRRVDRLGAAIREAITSLEHDEEHRASGSVQYIIDGLRAALDEPEAPSAAPTP